LRLQQILINLVSNAIKYTGHGSKIIVSTHKSTVSEVSVQMDSALARSGGPLAVDNRRGNDAVLVFSVSDSGPGIAPKQAHRLFRRFAQLDTKPSRTLTATKIGQPSGTGLGLHLCELFLKRMNGQIWATNNKGKNGCTFSFTLPLLRSGESNSFCGIRSDRITRHPSSSINQRPEKSRKGAHDSNVLQRRVLFVDDTLINRKVISRILKRVGFTNVTSVDSGKNAMLELTKVGDYDLVISDLQMPGMSGTELSRTIFNASPDQFQRPVVIGITADTGLDIAERCRNSGMSDLLYKPITVEDMRKYTESKIPFLQPTVWCDEG